MVEDRRDDLDDHLRSDAAPAVCGPEMDPAIDGLGPGGAVVWDDNRDRASALAVGAVVVGSGMLYPVVAVGVDLSNSDHSVGSQMATRGAHRVGWHDVTTCSQRRIGNDDGHCDVGLGARRDIGVPSLIYAESVEVCDALDYRFALGEQVKHRLPQRLWDTDLDRHRAHLFDRPRYAWPPRARWIRLRVASTLSFPGRHFWFSLGTWLEV